MSTEMQPSAALTPVLAAYGFSSSCRVTPMEGGLINQTFRVDEAGRRAVLQRLHPIFHPSLHLDIEAITAHLAANGLETPRLVRTREGGLWTSDEHGHVWRLLTWLEGRTIHALQRPETAHAAGRIVGRFHVAVSDLEHEFHFTRPGAHDTAAHLEALRRALAECRQHPNYDAVSALAERLLRHAAGLDPLPAVPARIVHGDLKVSNVLFDDALAHAVALLDLDTLARLTIPIELGDAFRSWCNPSGEDADSVSFRADLFAAALGGYAAGVGGLLSVEERDSLVLATETIALELATRFCADALRESYFGWNPRKFATRSEHNLVRARSQLAAAESVRHQRAALERIVRQHLPPFTGGA